ncbi:MAG: UDP-glucose 4-epimerase GalE [Geminicoccaceae bacterium]|nr:UDP-glucose 4-epimerase GalE [Geminicoccaceae bacterium]MDW8123386.1 UDP-glucose 4-epimerase GalE [Geminicoccaceae bacterium]
MSRATVLVTGGAGYVGSHACKALARAGFLPVTFDNLSTGNRWAVRWGPLEIGDVLDPPALHLAFKRHRPAAVMHFAAAALVGESVREPGLYWRLNLLGTLNLVEACRIHEVPVLVFSSTCAIYGIPPRIPIDEQAPKEPINPYGASKLAAERLLHDAEAAYGLRFAALRYFNAAGADPEGEIGEHRAVETHLVPLLLDAVLGLRPPLRLLGTDYPTPDGTAIRDYVHVCDLAVAHVRALERLLAGGPSFACNLGTGRGHSVRQVIETAERITGRRVPHVEAPRRPGDPPILVADATYARERLHLMPSDLMGLERILETAWAWHSEHRARRLRAN